MNEIVSEAQLEDLLSDPPAVLCEQASSIGGDLVVLGAGGKMGPTLARMARRALDEAGLAHRVYAVSRFGDDAVAAQLEASGVEVLRGDLRSSGFWSKLPDAAAVCFMVGVKFGTGAHPEQTWVTNTWVPGLCCERYRGVPTVAFSTGNVYPQLPAEGPGASEQTLVQPGGEYAWSALARERIFEEASRRHGTPVLINRLNYAVELRYGVLIDIARRVLEGTPIDLRMGAVNVVWQREANAAALLALSRATSPASVLNFTGSKVHRVRELATSLATRLGRAPRFVNTEGTASLLSDASLAWSALGLEETPIEQLLDWTAQWVAAGHPTWDKPTHYESTDGKF